ncbi:MAG: hypothetical protein QMD36_04960 [Candidatus Aenigmarchaeota archaeon]|nr:hypothetical protein [Candidatus Aenigmarchaeota archaeon]
MNNIALNNKFYGISLFCSNNNLVETPEIILGENARSVPVKNFCHITLFARNNGKETESFNVTASYDLEADKWVTLGTKPVKDLAPNKEANLTFSFQK